MGTTLSKVKSNKLDRAIGKLLWNTGESFSSYVARKNDSIYMIRKRNMSVAKLGWSYENGFHTLEKGIFYEYDSPQFREWESYFLPTNELIVRKKAVTKYSERLVKTKCTVNAYTGEQLEYDLKGTLIICYLAFNDKLLYTRRRTLLSLPNFRTGDKVILYHFDSNSKVRRSKLLTFY